MSLLDGTLVAVEPDSGRLLWTFDSGSPLVSASGSAEEGVGLLAAEGSSHAAPAAQQGRAIFPGVDGALYSYKQDGALGRGLEVNRGCGSSPDALCCACIQGDTPCSATGTAGGAATEECMVTSSQVGQAEGLTGACLRRPPSRAEAAAERARGGGGRAQPDGGRRPRRGRPHHDRVPGRRQFWRAAPRLPGVRRRLGRDQQRRWCAQTPLCS